MIRQLQVRGFKSWEDTGHIKFAPLTGFFGTNSSGKTSILQLLLMLKQTVESVDRKRVLHTGDNISIVDLGTFYELLDIWGHHTYLLLHFQYRVDIITLWLVWQEL